MADTAQDSAAEDSAGTREIRVFLSSTFRDFNEERKLLATQVFPELNRRARERGVELVEVDLRWGVTQQQAEGGHALGICLAEIERCKPYFIGMLGDSYGSLTPTERQLLEVEPALLEERSWLEGQIGSASYTELEIQHGLALLLRRQREQLEGHAFFYFRDPAWSNPKADAGEAGWRSDDPADRQKLELLRERIRSSGYPLVQGLASPQAIADQIKEDLWALIDRQFPEGEQPNALEKEARKHADYRRSRTRAGEYIGGEGYIKQLEGWIEGGQQQILITGESGAGKSALIANWMERHSQSHPADLLYAHHLGCTNDANALRPMLGRLIDTASAQLLEAEVITEALTVPEEWWELVAKVAETLQSLGRWCQQQGKRWIWVLDGLDRLDPDDQKALPWLPQSLPDGVQVVASALACPALEILSERGYTTLTIEPLASAEQEQLIRRYLKRYTKELDGGLRQQILSHSLAGSPVFLKVLLEELRQCGRHDTLKEQLDFYLSSQTVDDLYERVLERLENDGSGEAVRKVMTALWASRAGLTEPELLAITDLKPLQWAPIDLSLEKAFGRNGNRLVFDHDYLRIAVNDRYLPTEEHQRQAHSGLADWYQDREGWDERDSEELPWQLEQAGRLEDLRTWLLKPWALANLQWDRGSREVINYWLAVKDLGDGELDELIEEAVQEEIEKRKEDAEDQIWFIDRMAALMDEGGLYRELLLRLRTLSLELEEIRIEPDYEGLVSAMAALAGAHDDNGNAEAAERLYLRALELIDDNLGQSHQLHLNIFAGLGILYREVGDLKNAMTFARMDFEVSKALLGTKSPRTLTAQQNLANMYWTIGDYDKAREIGESTLKTRIDLLGRLHPDTLTTMGSIALVYDDIGDKEAAGILHMQCIEGQEKLLGAEHPDTLTSIQNYAMHCLETGDIQEAHSLMDNALKSSEKLLGPEHPGTLSRARSLGSILTDMGEYQRALDIYRCCLESYAQQHGSDSPNALETMNDIARLLTYMGQLDLAEEVCMQVYKIRVDAFGSDNRDTLVSLNNLGSIYRKQGLFDEAMACYKTAHSGLGSVLGEHHPDTLSILKRINLLERDRARTHGNA